MKAFSALRRTANKQRSLRASTGVPHSRFAVWLALACIALGLAAILPTAISARTDVQTVRFGSVGGLSDAGIDLADSLGYFTSAGIHLKVYRESSASDLVTDLATNNLDVAGVAISPALFNAGAEGIKIKVVGDKGSISPGWTGEKFMVQKSLVGATEADTIHNLKGKVLATTDPTATPTTYTTWLLNKYGMQISDVQLHTLPFPSIAAGLVSGQVAGAMVLEPFLSTVETSGCCVAVSDMTEVLPKDASGVLLMYSEKFDGKKSLGQAFMNAYMRGVRAYIAAEACGQNKAKVDHLLATWTKLPLAVESKTLREWIDPNQQVNQSFISKVENWELQQHYIKSIAKVSSFMDTSFATNAVKQLGTYKGCR